MKNFILCIILVLISCADPIEKPKNIIPKEMMAEIIAELAITDQMSYLNEMGNMETQTIYIFQKYNVTGTQFIESHKFYLSEIGTIDEIYQTAQNIIAEKDPEAKSFFEKQKKDTLLQDPIMK